MRRFLRSIFVTIVALFCVVPAVQAQQSSSTNYQVDEVFFGAGGELNACSGSYCSKQSAGETGVGNTSSTNYQAQGGFNTNRAPSLELNVSGTTDLGILSTGSTATATGTFSVKSYLASGYVVQTQSDPPQSIVGPTHTFATPSTPTAATPGTEQFGINVVANTNPTTFGANPVQVPDNTFSFGSAAANYNTPNLYKYTKGDTIASSASSSGQTNYTVSYIFNISNQTPAGEYQFNHIIVATSTF